MQKEKKKKDSRKSEYFQKQLEQQIEELTVILSKNGFIEICKSLTSMSIARG